VNWRLKVIEGIENFRDFGGYRTRDGRSVKTGLLFRSAKLSGVTPAGETALTALGLSAIVDLRRVRERRRDPTGAWSSTVEMINSDAGGEDDPWSHFLKTADQEMLDSIEHIQAFARDFYASAPYDSRHPDLFTRYFQALAGANGPILVHCTAGKDRTGMIVALTHHLLGVAREDMIVDYLRTNEMADMATRAASISAALSAEMGRAPGEAAIHAALTVRQEYLEHTLATVVERSGSIDAYLRDVLGVTPALRDTIRKRLIA
jgi:protein tyrosine/serine phosphatase